MVAVEPDHEAAAREREARARLLAAARDEQPCLWLLAALRALGLGMTPEAVAEARRAEALATEAGAEAVAEAARWLRAESGHPVGLLGMSLGGYLSATAAGLDRDLAFVIAMVPPVCFGDLAWRFLPLRGASAGETPALGYDELRRAFRIHSPLAHAPVVARGRLLVVAGRGDRIVPPEHPTSLWRHWGEPAMHWFDGSHLAPFGRAGIAAAVRAHLARLGLA